MKIKKNFTTGILTGICGILLLLVITGSTITEDKNENSNFEFYDLKDTRGLIFNKSTGEIKYEIIRTEALPKESLDLYHQGRITVTNF